MFKTDKESLEKISFMLDERDLANYQTIVERLRCHGLLQISDSDYDRIIDGLDKIAQLKMERKVYGFHVSDNYGMGGEGVELHLRQGNMLKEWYISDCRPNTKSVSEAAYFLRQHKVSIIYTGPISSEFLGVPAACDDETPIYTNMLTDDDILEFESKNIKVISLDTLI